MHPILNRLGRGLLVSHSTALLLCCSTALLISPFPAHADIYQWEYINPADPAQGKQQSTTLAPEGAGVDAVPGSDLSYHDLTKAYLIGADIRNASLLIATLTDADFTDADVRGANFSRDLRYPNGTGITPAQLYSTASYQAYDLSGIELVLNDLGGGNFAGQNLLGASFWGADLTGANLRGANLKNANLSAGIIDADFTDAEVRGATFSSPICLPTFACFSIGSPVTTEQLYSTATYQSGDLRDVHGDLSNLITTNLVLPNGHLDGLDLEVGGHLTVRDYDGNPSPIPIVVDKHLAIGPGGTLRMVFEADVWDSMISFAPGIPVTLGGTLALIFAADVNPATQISRTFDLFDWTGVNLTGAFAISSPYQWDVSNLYTTGEITLTAVPEPSCLFLLSGVLAAIFAIRLRANLLPSAVFQVTASIFSAAVIAAAARADIYQWEYVNPADPSQGKRQSTTLAPDGAGVDAGPFADLSRRNLTMAYLIGADFSPFSFPFPFPNGYLLLSNLSGTNLTDADLTSAKLYYANLSGANLGATLTDAAISYATLTGADFTDAEVRGARFSSPPCCGGIGITLAQLYSTASYQVHDLTGIDLSNNVLSGSNFAGQNLTNASFQSATLTGADFREANLTNAYLGGATLTDADFTRVDFRGTNLAGVTFDFANLTGADFRQMRLTDAYFNGATLSGADLTDADVRGAVFNNTTPTGFTASQFYSTASYKAHDLTGIGLLFNDLSGWNFTGQNLNIANFYRATLTAADFREANLSSTAFWNATLTSADFREANLTNADFSAANLTGANFSQANLTNSSLSGATLTGADFTDSQVQGAYLQNTTASGFTAAQLYSTASYKSHDLTGIHLSFNDLSGWNFAGQNLANANFDSASITRADFTGADVRGASFLLTANTTGITLAQLYSTASYQARDLRDVGLGFNGLSGADFAGQNLTNVDFAHATLTGADFREANLTNAFFGNAALTGVDFANAEVGGTTFSSTALTQAQLYSTASYQARDLSGIVLDNNHLAGWNFADQNLTDANFAGATLTDTIFRHANLTDAVFTVQIWGSSSHSNATLTHADFGEANLTNVDFGAADLTGANFRQANLANAKFSYVAGYTGPLSLSFDNDLPVYAGATLTDADFTGADVRRANFGKDLYPPNGTGITLEQLYSTASYQAKDLTGIVLWGNDLASGNFAGQNLSNASFGLATLADADFTAADARGAVLYPWDAITRNLIWPDGQIHGLNLEAGGLLVVRDYAGEPRTYANGTPAPPLPIPITVDQHLAMGPGGTLRMVFEADAWDSTISFAPGIPVTLGGTLELTFAADVNLATQVGRTFVLFDWTGVLPNGAFTVSSPYAWELTNLYTTGEATLISVPEPNAMHLFNLALATFMGMGRVFAHLDLAQGDNP